MKLMYKKLSAIGLIALSLSTYSLEEREVPSKAIQKKIDALWKRTTVDPLVGFSSDIVDSKLVEARVLGLRVGADIRIPYSEDLSIAFRGGAILEAGSNSSFVTNEYEPNRIWALDYAQVNYQPWNFLTLEGGALSQREYHSPLLVSASAFLGARETLSLNFTKDHRIYIKMQQSIPNNINLVQRIGVVEDNGTPFYYNEAVGIELEGDLLGLQIEASQFRFESLAAGIANISRNFGNSVSSGNNISSAFLYGYKGYNLMWDINASPFGKLEFEFYGQWLYNDEAPEGRNKGHIYGFGLEYDPWDFEVETFRNESDSSVAYYNSKFYSHNNQEGMLYRIGYEIDNYQEYEFTYVSSSVIEYRDLQADTEIFKFSFIQWF